MKSLSVTTAPRSAAVALIVALVVLMSWLAMVPTVRAVETDMVIDTTALDFGDVNVGNSATLGVTLTNGGSDPFGPINMFGGAPPTVEFNASQNCQAVTLAAGASCTVTYSFSPTGAGTFTDASSFTISETAVQADGEDFTVSLSGTGVNPITVSPTTIDFGSIAVGSTSPAAGVTVTNTSDDPFGPINMFGGAPPTVEFNASQNCQAVTLAAGASCTISYTFTPSAIGVFTDTSSFTISATASQAGGEDFTIALTGCGAPCPTATPTPTPTPTMSATPTAPPASPTASATATPGDDAGPTEAASPGVLPDTAGTDVGFGAGAGPMLLAVFAAALGILTYVRLAHRRTD